MPAGLTAAEGWIGAVVNRLDRRLNAPDRAPIAVAVSGGGDSLALLLLAQAWAARRRRPLVALTVDHRLQPDSDAWTRFVAERAEGLDLDCRTLTWIDEPPATGLPAAARCARHALLANAARGVGARVVLLGHTADDALEAAEMRRCGGHTPTPLEWSPSPAWPEGRGVFLLRPLLAVRRADLRAWLAARGETWIEDPANDDRRYSRSRARQSLAAAPIELAPAPSRTDAPSLAMSEGLGGELTGARRDLVAGAQPRRRLGAMILCAAGGERPARTEPLERLLRRLEEPTEFTASLAGARIEARADEVMICREAGEQARGRLAGGILPSGESVFDGRFLMRTAATGARTAALRGFASRLPAAERRRLRLVAPGARGSLPVVISSAAGVETVSCPILAQGGAVAVRPLVLGRLRAALGVYADEAALWRVAEVDAGA